MAVQVRLPLCFCDGRHGSTGKLPPSCFDIPRAPPACSREPAAGRGLCRMQEIPTETAEAIAAAQAATPPRAAVPSQRFPRWLRLGIGGRLALGLAAVCAVVIWGHILATRTTRIAVQAVRSMQTEHEPRAQSASAVVESLVAYDRAVIEYLQGGRGSGFGGITAAGDSLEAAILTYFQRPAEQRHEAAALTPRVSAPPGTQLLPQLTSHMEHGR